MNFARIGLATLFTVAIGPCATAANPDYAYAWPLQIAGDSAAWQVELTPEVYAAIGTEDLRDLEVVNAAGEAVPIASYQPAMPTMATTADWIDLPIFTLPVASSASANSDEAIRLHIERGADGKLRQLDAAVGNAAQTDAQTSEQTEWLLDASAGHDPLDALRIDWTARGDVDATARFEISASDDLQQWRVFVADAAVLSLNQGGNVLQRHEIALHGAHAAYLRLRRLDSGPALPWLSARTRYALPSTPARPTRQWLEAQVRGSDTKHVDQSLPTVAGDRPVAYRYRLPAALAAVGLRLELADENSVVAGRMLSRRGSSAEDDSHWWRRGNFVAFRLRQDGALIDNDEFPVFPGGRARDWLVELATPLDHAPTLTIAYVPDRFVFLAQGPGPYRLVAGSARARRADYPVDAALAQLRGKLGAAWQPPLAKLGERQLLNGAQALAARPTTGAAPHDWKTWLLWAVLVAAAAVVGGLALSLLRKS